MNFEASMAEAEPIIREVVSGGGEFVLAPKGTSMLPLIRQGKDAVVLVAKGERLKAGQIPLYKRDDGKYVLHRIIKLEKDGTYTMCGDNQRTLEKGIRDDQIIAVTSAVIRNKKRKSVSSFSLRLYYFFWRSFFLRRVIFKIKRMLKGER